jgi:phytoene dehydrogenase-like protein
MDVAPLALPPLDRNCTADVCVIGAGIGGLSTAYNLVREGRSVVVVDDGPVGGGMTQRTIDYYLGVMTAAQLGPWPPPGVFA